MELFDKSSFVQNNIHLSFLKVADDLKYSQNQSGFESSLSIIDVLMFNSKDEIKSLIKKVLIVWVDIIVMKN